MTGIINDLVGQGRAMWGGLCKSSGSASRKEKLFVGNKAGKSQPLKPQRHKRRPRWEPGEATEGAQLSFGCSRRSLQHWAGSLGSTAACGERSPFWGSGYG